MARIMTEHYESGDNTEQRLLYQQGTIIRDSGTYGLSGDGSRRWVAHNNSVGWAYRRLSMRGSYSDVYIAMWGYMVALPASNWQHVFRFYKSQDTVMASFVMNGSGFWVPRIGVTNQTAGSLIMTFGSGVWHCFEVHYKIHASTGVLELKVDGQQACIFSGDTTYSSQTSFDMIDPIFSALTDCGSDGLCINDTTGGADNSWVGIQYCASRDPTGDSGTYDAWGNSTGSNAYALVDEYPPSESDYIYSVTNAQKQGFTYPSYSLPSDAVPISVIEESVARKISSGQIKLGNRYSGTDYESAAKDLGVDNKVIQERRIVDPSGAAWSLTSIDAAETLIEAVI